jgi:hypothetical protein
MSQNDQRENADRLAVAHFSGADITAVQSASDQLIYASLPQLCASIGLDAESQRQRIEEHAVLSEGLRQFDLTSGGRVLTTWCLKVNLIPLWLALVPVKRLRPEKRERILLFQRQVADVLSRLFGPAQAAPDIADLPTASLSTRADPPYAHGLAIARLETETAELAGKFEGFVDYVDARLAALEVRLPPTGPITEEQMRHIGEMFALAGMALSNKLGGGNHIGSIYGRFYRAFGVTSYKAITQSQYPKAIAWLDREIQQHQR